MAGYLFGLMAVAAVVVYFLASARARANQFGATGKTHSRPIYHGLNAAIWTGVPAFIFLLLWLLGQNSIINMLVLGSYPGAELMSGPERNLLISEVRQVAAGNIFREPSAATLAAAEHFKSLQSLMQWAMVAVVAAALAVGAFFGLRVVGHRFRARHSVERAVTWFMMFSSFVAIMTTLGIVASLLYEAGQFFARVPITEFLFGLRWEPQIALRADQVAGQGAFGMIPVRFGSLVISALAVAVAVPTGVLSAIYLTEYSGERFRAVVKPLLEILAGIPTVVYGFFAVLTVAPLVRNLGLAIGIDAAPNSALAAGGVYWIKAGNPNALRHIVLDQCLPNQLQHRNPAPCAQVKPDAGYVVFKDRTGPLQYLLVPT